MAARLVLLAVAAVLFVQPALSSSRLRETPLNLEKMLLRNVDPVDPHGDPKRIAGFFELNRTEVRATSGTEHLDR